MVGTTVDQVAVDYCGQIDWAVSEHHALLAEDSFRTESYQALFEIYRGAGMVDEAWCVAATLCFLRKGTSEHAAFHSQHRPRGLVMARARLAEDVLRRHVQHPDQDRYLTGVLGLIAPAVAGWRAVELPGCIGARERIDVSMDPTLFSCMVKYVRGVLDVSQPEVYPRPTDPGDLTLLNIKRGGRLYPTLVAFQDVLRSKAEASLAFTLGRELMLLYPPHFCFAALDHSPQAVKQVVYACLHWFGLPVQGDRAALTQIAKEVIGRTTLPAREQLRRLIARWVASEVCPDVEQWAAASELTACRVGLLLSGDLQAAAQTLVREQARPWTTLAPRDKLEELTLYSISPDYFAARRAIGVHVTG